jgi:hypothetical protein
MKGNARFFGFSDGIRRLSVLDRLATSPWLAKSRRAARVRASRALWFDKMRLVAAV